jgi:Tfp pilus assembly protein PilO
VKQITRDNLIVTGVLLGVVAATTALVYMPQKKTLHQLQTRIARQEIHLVDNAGRASSVPSLLRHVQAMKKRYSNFDRRLPEQQELGGFLREISGNLSEERSLSNQLIEPGNPSRSKLFHTLPIILRFQGSYLSLASFLKRMEQTERLTQVEKLSITSCSPAPAGTTQGVDIELLMNIYFTES